MSSYQCTLYRAKSLTKLQNLLQIKQKNHFQKLSSNIASNPMGYYSSFTNKDNRVVFTCSKYITKLHKRVMKLFNIEQASYLKSGVKKSHILPMQKSIKIVTFSY